MNPYTYGTPQESQPNISYSYSSQLQQNLQIPNQTQQRNKTQTTYEYQPPKQSNYLIPQKTKDAEYKDHKQKNKNMYSSGMAFSSSQNGLSKLSSFGRQVKQPVNQKDQIQTQKIVKPTGDDKYTTLFNNYSGGRQTKMAASAIFPTQQNQFERFPAFNLGYNQSSQSSTSSSGQVSAPKANQSAKQKRQRELLQIKKQLDELNKRMMANADKNKNNSIDNYTQPEIKVKPAVISQSAIFEPTKNTTTNYSSFESTYNNVKPNNKTNKDLSTDLPYTQAKKYQLPTKPYSTPIETYDMKPTYQNQTKQAYSTKPYSPTYNQTYTPSYNTVSSTTTQKINNYTNFNNQKQLKNNNGVKSYEFQKKVEQPAVSKTNNYQSYDTSANYKIPEKFKYQTNTNTNANTYSNANTTTNNTNNNLGYNNTYTQNTSSTTSQSITDKYSPVYSQSNKNQGYNYSNSLSYQTQNKPSYSFKTQNNPSSASTASSYSSSSYTNVQPTTQAAQVYNFSKPTTTNQTSTQGGAFKKKKGPIAQIIQAKNQIDMRKAIHPDSSTSTHQEVQHRQIKRIESIDDDDFSPVIQQKKFKITDFVVGKKMGKGQFGQVLLVRHKQTGWVCGLKVMNKKDIKDQDYVGQIARQLSIQFYLSHRNITQLYGYFEDQKNFYLLVEFCSGGQLLERLKQQRRMSERDVSLIIRQVCQGVDYIHKQLIIHRDIKPQNMMFNFGVVKIADFGWAVYRGFGMRKTASGSPLYYPPQIVKGQSYDDKIDVWCIGMMAYECIIGKIPFRVYTEMDLGRIVSDQITFPSWVDVTDQAQDFILKTLKKKGDERMEIKQMLRHPFITKHQQTQLSPSILQQFKRVLS